MAFVAQAYFRTIIFSFIISLLLTSSSTSSIDVSTLNIPLSQLPYHLNRNPHHVCVNGTRPCDPTASLRGACWGYEPDCIQEKRFLPPKPCEGDARGWAQHKEEQSQMFFEQGDFGYIRKRLQEWTSVCLPEKSGDSSLSCSQYARVCHGRHIYLDLRRLRVERSNTRFKEDLFQDGEIGGHCSLDQSFFGPNAAHKSPLQSWFSEIEKFSSLQFKPSKSKRCDVRIHRPTFFVKLDAGINMFHHFCDFVNLYMSQHVNGSFDLDVNVLMWDTSGLSYADPFAASWSAFTRHPILRLDDYFGKRLCFDDVVMGLLPRMRFGHFYNMPLIPGCSGTGLYKAFSNHFLHRLGVYQNGPHPSGKVRVTLLERKTTYRNVVNQQELYDLLLKETDVDVTVVHYHREVPFLEQLRMTHNSDIFIGLHGAGLTHLLFLPDWAVVFELYSCDDEDCYKNLARLRGVKYITWENSRLLYPRDEGHHPTLGPHKKFTDYGFEPSEFLRLVRREVDFVKKHPDFWMALKNKRKKDEL